MRRGPRERSGNWRAGCLETRTSRSGRGRRKRTRNGTSPAAYSIFVTWPQIAGSSCSILHFYERMAKVASKATTNLDQIRAWWTRWPNANIGYAPRGSLLIIDIDLRNQGKESWERLTRAIPMPETRCVQ